MILFGAGGHAKVIVECLLDMGKVVNYFIDNDPLKKEFIGIKVIQINNFVSSKEEMIISIGDNFVRKRIAENYSSLFGKAIHSSAIVSPSAIHGEGTVIFQGVKIQAEVKIGNHCIINTGASIDHDCKLSNYVHIAPGAILCGNVIVGECSFIGAGSVIKQGINIGKNVVIGAGSVVLKDIPDGCTAYGNPARIKMSKNE